MKILLRVRFWIQNFTTRQILNWKFYNASDFESEYFFKKHDFEGKKFLKSTILKKKLHTKKITF